MAHLTIRLGVENITSSGTYGRELFPCSWPG
jgi:hypothetical protein